MSYKHRWDEMILKLQRWVDRLTCRFMGVSPTTQTERRFIIIQIDGLSERRLKLAMERGRMPFVRRLLQRGLVKETPYFCSLPTSTAAFQAGLFYGNVPDIPAWKFFNKKLNRIIHFPDPGAAALIEEQEAANSEGLMKDGTCYGAVLSGDAETSMVGFSRLYKPKFGFNWQTVKFFLPNFVTLWVFTKIFFLSFYELVYGLLQIIGGLINGSDKSPSLAQLGYRIFFQVVWRQLLTLGVCADIYQGKPAIFVNYLSYDVYAHKYGPGTPTALRTLKGIDASIRQIYRVARRVPEYNYDIYILSDHGMAEATPFQELSAQPLSSVVLGAMTEQAERAEQSLAIEVVNDSQAVERLDWLAHLRAVTPFLPGLLATVWDRYILSEETKWLKRLRPQLDFPKLLDDVKIVPAGPNVLVYFLQKAEKLTLEEIDAIYPGAVARLSEQAGIGLVLARDQHGPVFYWRGELFRVDANFTAANCPFRHLTYRALLMRAIAELIDMPSAGDLIIYGNGAGQRTISYVGERGSHAGISADELFAFVIYPKNIDFAFERITRPRDFYEFFRQYRSVPQTEAPSVTRRTA